jgi:hypothetical protein
VVGTVAEHQLLVRAQSSSIKPPRRLRRRVGLQVVADDLGGLLVIAPSSAG